MRRARMLSALALCAPLLLALAVACSSPPQAESAQPAPPPKPDLSTPQGEIEYGAQGQKSVEASQGVVQNPVLTPYVKAIGRRLARNAPGFRYDYQFSIVDDWPPNAFAIPGGYVFVSRGLLALSDSEDELANVIGHEIAHVAQRHSSAQSTVAGGGVSQFFQMFSLAAYSRNLESAADRVGQGIAAVSGYDPAAMHDFLIGLDRLDRVYSGSSRMTGFLDSHPGSRQRAGEMSQRAGTIHWEKKPGISKGPRDHLRKLDGLTVGGDPKQGVFDGSRFLHPDLAFTMRFPDGWRTVNSPQAVGAMSPNRRSQIIMEFAGKGTDPKAAADTWLQRFGGDVGIDSQGAAKVTGRPAYRIVGRSRHANFTTTFIVWRGFVYAISCAAPGPEVRKLEGLCLSTTRSFRPMTRELLANVKEQTLRVVEAKPGESLAGLSKRTGNTWNVAETAAWNAVPSNTRFEGGELVKVVEQRPYLPKGMGAPPKP